MGRALDLGCAVGRTSIELAKQFKEVVGIDFSNAFIKAADTKLLEHEEVANKVKFVVGDACNLSPSLGKFNLIFGGNLIDRLPDPSVFLTSVGNFLEPNGLLVLTSPYSWLEQYTPKDKWIGGYL
jgi:2-polyprenyl-3-methyl-5-hydroxy-6-metoxy-1,4-benzoquinol methylase